MFGHYPVASWTVGDSGTVVHADVTLVGVPSTTSIDVLSLSTNNNFTIDFADAEGQIEPLGLSVDSLISVTGVDASTALNNVAFNISKGVTGVDATSSTNTITATGIANLTLGDVSSNIFAGNVAPADDNPQQIDAVSADTFVEDVTPLGINNAVVTGTESTTDVGTLTANGAANPVLDTISSTLINSTLDFQAKSSITLSSVTSTGTAEDLPPLVLAGVALPSSVFALFSVKIEDPTAVKFDFQAFADDLVYSKENTVVILPAGLLQPSRTVTIPAQNFTVTIESVRANSRPSTIFIPAQNFTVTIEPYRDLPKTVFITN